MHDVVDFSDGSTSGVQKATTYKIAASEKTLESNFCSALNLVFLRGTEMISTRDANLCASIDRHGHKVDLKL